MEDIKITIESLKTRKVLVIDMIGQITIGMAVMEQMLISCPGLLLEVGDCPNIETSTLGGKVFWRCLGEKDGWKLQYNPVVRHARILDENGVRKAWGDKSVMIEKFKRLTRDEFLEPGDVVGVVRKRIPGINIKTLGKVYEHYGVYVGNGKMVHFTSAGEGEDNETSMENAVVKETSLEEFLDGARDYFVLYFAKGRRVPSKIQAKTSFNLYDVNLTYYEFSDCGKLVLYSPEETVKRAYEELGKKGYNLIVNNCEHFAVWCKTGKSKSYQVNIFKIAIRNLIKKKALKGPNLPLP